MIKCYRNIPFESYSSIFHIICAGGIDSLGDGEYGIYMSCKRFPNYHQQRQINAISKTS